MKISHICSVKVLCSIFLFFILISATSAQKLITGVLRDSTTQEAVEFAHVFKYNTTQATVTSLEGKFQFPVKEGDTLVFSSVGYQTIGWVVKPDWFGDTLVVVTIPRDTVYLQEVDVYDRLTEQQFRQRFRSYEPQDTSFWYFGMDRPDMTVEDPMMSDKKLKKLAYVASHPITALYDKQIKEVRKYNQIMENSHQSHVVNEKFNREWVGEVTGLEGDELTRFMDYCDYSQDYLERITEYNLYQDMLAKLELFKRENKESKG